eukprot:Gb_26545 [translate_table: standard]
MNTVFGFRHEENDGMYIILVDFGMVEQFVLMVVDGGATVGADLEPLESCFIFGWFPLASSFPVSPFSRPPLHLLHPAAPFLGPPQGALRVTGASQARATPLHPPTTRGGASRPPCGRSQSFALYRYLCKPPAACTGMPDPCLAAMTRETPLDAAVERPCNHKI